MTFLPVVHRELYVASRKRHTFWVRMAAAVFGVGWSFFLLGLQPFLRGVPLGLVQAGQAGAALFQTLATVAFWACLFAGILLTADCLSSEKREDTLGLLFLTDLKGYDVVLGKLAARSLTALYCVLALVPVLALPILLGGVTGGEFARMAAVLVNTLLFSLSVGMCVSAFSRERNWAFGGAELLLLFLTFFWPVFGRFLITGGRLPLGRGPGLQSLGDQLWFIGPLQPFSLAFEPGFLANRPGFYGASLWMLGQSLLLLMLASWWAPHSWQTKPPRGPRATLRALWDRWKYGPPAWRTAFRARLLDRNPICWLGSRDRTPRYYLWAMMGLMLAFALCLNRSQIFNWSSPIEAASTVLFVHTILKLLVALDAGARFGELRRTGTIQMIWATRLSVADIVRGQRMAVQQLFREPVLAALAFDLFWLCKVAANVPARPDFTWLAPVSLCVALMFVWDLSALAWVGLWLGLNARRPMNAAYGALGQVLILPSVVFVVLGAGFKFQASPYFLAFLWASIGGLTNWMFSANAQARLHEELRWVIQEQLPSHLKIGKDYEEDFALLKRGRDS